MKAGLRVKRQMLSEKHNHQFVLLKKKQHYRFCKSIIKKNMKKDAIKHQTILKMRDNIRLFFFFLINQKKQQLLIPSKLTLLNFFYSVYLIEFQSYYKLSKFLSIKNIYFIFLKTSIFYFSKSLKSYYNDFLYYLPYLLNFFT